MKVLLWLLCLAFSIMMLIRLIEMSFIFDGVDLLWTIIFLCGAMICGKASAESTDR